MRNNSFRWGTANGAFAVVNNTRQFDYSYVQTVDNSESSCTLGSEHNFVWAIPYGTARTDNHLHVCEYVEYQRHMNTQSNNKLTGYVEPPPLQIYFQRTILSASDWFEL